jgi:hypothetical protein
VEPDEKRAGDVEEAPRPERTERRDDDLGPDVEELVPGAEE